LTFTLWNVLQLAAHSEDQLSYYLQVMVQSRYTCAKRDRPDGRDLKVQLYADIPTESKVEGLLGVATAPNLVI